MFKLIFKIFKLPFVLLKNFSFLAIALIFLLLSSAILLQKISILSGQLVASSSALKLANQKHRVELKKVIAKEKAKARLKQTIVAVPLIGTMAYAAFELSDFKNWKKENPSKDKSDYACETANSYAEVIEEVLAELPKNARPPDKILSSLTKICTN